MRYGLERRAKSGPRTPYGYLDRALGDLVRQVVATGPDSPQVAKMREAIVQRARRIARGEVKRAAAKDSRTWGGSEGVK